MSDRLSPEREAEIRARAEAATPGPWVEYADYGKDFYAYVDGSYLRGVGTLSFGDGEDAEADRAFTLNARSDVPALLAELAAVRAERDRWERTACHLAGDAGLIPREVEYVGSCYVNLAGHRLVNAHCLYCGKPEQEVAVEGATS